ncbi:Rne/Rng family ribonuclease [Nonomuraea rhodomycinica]|uniref:Rne/Rng family ribonuclease n=1 Tax=Nonomuraea rhodomycinica TaxID=1712872 RepID=UPI001FE51FEE|nr:Rne/Rng family ribonuclease [Nonomuraea rhodomycinica]
MLENEPNTGATGSDGGTTEQSPTTPRRRVASRPAGPPPEIPEDEPAQVTVSAAEAAAVSAARAPETTGGDGQETSAVEAAVADAVAEAVSAGGEDDGAAEAEKPKRSRTRSTATTSRRRTSRKAEEAEPATTGASAGAADQSAEQAALETADRVLAAETTAPDTGAAPESGAAETEAEAAPVRRRRTRKKAEPEAATVAEATGPTGDAGAIGTEATAIGADTSAGGDAATAGSARAGSDTGTDAQAASGAADSARAGRAASDAVEEDILDELPEDEPLDDEPAGEDLDEDTDRPSLLADPFGFSARRADEPDAVFQRPAAIFAPLFQAPDPSQAQPFRPEPVRAEPARPEPEAADDADESDETGTDDVDAVDSDSDQEEEEGGSRRRRRRRGGRGRGKARERDDSDADDSDEEGDEGEDEQPEEQQEEESSSSRRRRRRRRRGADDGAEPSGDDPPNTVVRIRAPRSGRASLVDTSADGVQSVRGSTRLEAKKQRRREGRELGRRRPPIITESEFLARRESVDRMMVVRRQGDRTQIAVLEDGVLVEHYVNREASQSYVGNVYLGKVQNVLPSMEAAFVDIGKGRNAVLYAGEVNFDTAGLEGQPKRIESALKSGQSVLVQVTKDPIGHKGARLTSQISLPGRYLVYVPDGSMTGISRKLPDKERTRLKSILKKVMPENAGVIVRTAAEGASEDELARDVARLSAQWENIQKKAKSASPPELLSAEPDLTIRVVRDVFNEDFSSLVVQGEEAWETVEEYVKYVAPHLEERLSRWDGDQGDVFESYRIDEQLAKAMERKVWLPSGGSLVIDRTEAMTVVDVNTGKFTGQGGNLEETVTRNNLEAAEEIVRQLRLRDIGGIIVIDFIDMVLESNRDLVLRRLLECLARDRTKHQVAEVTSLGLVQMTRKRVGQGLLEAFSTPCECCNGRGLIVSTEPVEAKPEPRGTQGKMSVEKAVAEKLSDKGAEKVSAAKDSSGRDTVTGALDDVPVEDDQAGQSSGRGRRRSRRAKSAE